MFTYQEDGTSIVCSLVDVPLSELNAAEIFKVGSCWKDEKLIYNMVRTFSTKNGWKACRNSTYIKYSCWRKPNPNDRSFHNGGSIRKDCKWRINLKATKVRIATIKTGNNSGKKNQRPVFDDDVPVIVSVGKYEHTGTCNPSAQQQLMQRSHSGDYVSKIGEQSLFTLVKMYEQKDSLPSSFV